MNLNPTVRWLLTALAVTITGLGSAFAAYDVVVPQWLGITIAVLGTFFGALNLVPPQLGGTQQGVVNPSITEPPPADVNDHG